MKTLLVLTLLAFPCVAATYYVDLVAGNDSNVGTKVSPWLHAPGMGGFTATYSHVAGDRFIFKGGQTCGGVGISCFSSKWILNNSGSIGNNDYYGVDVTWFAGSSYSPPVIDGGHKNPVTINPYIDMGGSFVTLDGLRIQNIGVSPSENGGTGLNQGNYAIDVNGTNHDILIENMILPVESRVAILIALSSGTYANFEFKNNDISACSWGIAGGGAIMTGFSAHDNAFHDFFDQMANAVHGDGIYIFGDITGYTIDAVAYNNRGYGNFGPSDTSGAGMSEFIWLAASYGNTYIYNNVFSESDTNGSAGILHCDGPDTTHRPSCFFFNNSIEIGPGFYGIRANWAGTVTVKNNIVTGGAQAIAMAQFDPIGTLISNYDDLIGFTTFCCSDNTTAYTTWAQFRTAGYEANGFNTTPVFVNPTDSGTGANLRLQSSSPLIGQGVNLTSLGITALNSDITGIARPASGPWDIGAYQFAGSSPGGFSMTGHFVSTGSPVIH